MGFNSGFKGLMHRHRCFTPHNGYVNTLFTSFLSFPIGGTLHARGCEVSPFRSEKNVRFNLLLIKRMFVFFWGGGGEQQPPVDQGLLIQEVSRSHTTTQHSQ